MYFCGLCCLKKDVIYYSKNISDVKKGEAKKVQVTKWLKGAKSLWSQEEKIHLKKYLSGWSDVEQWKKIKPVVFTIVKLRESEGIRQLVNQ